MPKITREEKYTAQLLDMGFDQDFIDSQIKDVQQNRIDSLRIQKDTTEKSIKTANKGRKKALMAKLEKTKTDLQPLNVEKFTRRAILVNVISEYTRISQAQLDTSYFSRMARQKHHKFSDPKDPGTFEKDLRAFFENPKRTAELRENLEKQRDFLMVQKETYKAALKLAGVYKPHSHKLQAHIEKVDGRIRELNEVLSDDRNLIEYNVKNCLRNIQLPNDIVEAKAKAKAKAKSEEKEQLSNVRHSLMFEDVRHNVKDTVKKKSLEESMTLSTDEKSKENKIQKRKIN